MVNKTLKYSVAFLFVCTLLFGASFVLAAASPLPGLKTAVEGTDLGKNTNPFYIVGYVINAVWSMLSVALVVTIIYAGVMWGFLSGGEVAKIQKAKDLLKNAIIGLIIVIAAYGIMTFVMDSLTKGPTASPSATPPAVPHP